MACKLENIKDPKHAMLVSRYGMETGTTMFLEQYGKLMQFYEKDSLSAKELIKMSEALADDNDYSNTEHRLIVTDGKSKFEYGTQALKPGSTYSTTLEVNWAGSIRKAGRDNTLKMPDMTNRPSMEDEDMLGDIFDEPMDHNDMGDDFMDDDPSDPMEDIVDDEGDDVDNEIGLVDEESFGETLQADSSAGKGINKILSDMNAKVKDIEKRVGIMMDNSKAITETMKKLEAQGVDKNGTLISELKARKKAIGVKIQEYKNTTKELKENMDEVAESIRKAGMTEITKNLRILFNVHKDFAKRIDAMENPDPSDLILAIDGLKMWADIRTTIWDLDAQVDDFVVNFLGDIESIAKDSTFRSLETKQANKFVSTANNDFGTNILLSGIAKLKNVNGITALVQTLGDTSNQILQAIDKWIKEVATRSNAEVYDFKKKTIAMFETLKKAGLNPEVFLDKDKDGKPNGNLIGRFQQEFHDQIERIESAYVKELERVRKIDPRVAKTVRQNERAAAILARNKSLNSRAIIIDPVEAIDPVKRAVLKAELTRVTGDEAYAEDKLIEAQNKYERYLEEMGAFEDWAEGEVGKREGFDEAAKVKAVTRWKKEHNPSGYAEYIKLNTLEKVKLDPRDYLSIDKYSVMIPRDTIGGKPSGYYNEAFKTLMNNKVASKFYYEYTNLMQEMLAILPSYAKRGLDESFLPHVRREAMKKVTRDGFAGFFSNIGTDMIESVTSDSNDFNKYGRVDSTGRPIRSVPIRNMGGMQLADRTLDLENIINEFAKMAITYKHITLVEDKVAMAMNVMKAAKEYTTNPDGTMIKDKSGKLILTKGALENSIQMAQYAIDHNFYGIRNKVEGFTGWKHFDKKKNSIKIIGSVNPAVIIEEYNNLVNKEGVVKAMEAIKKKYKDNVVFVNEKDAAKGIKQKMAELEDQLEKGTILQQRYDKEMESYMNQLRGMGRNFVVSKAVDQFINFSYYKAFAWNPFPGIANIAYGNIAIFNHAVGGQDFNKKQAVFGMAEARKSSIMSIRSGNLESNKLYNIMTRFGIVGDIMDGLSSQKKNNMSRFGPMGLLSEGDYLNRSAVLCAMMQKEAITDLSGKTRSLYEAYNRDGTWNVSEFGDDPAWNGRLDSYSESQKATAFIRKAKAVNKMLHGNMDPETAVMAKKSVLGRALAQYRLSWMVDGFASRFEPKRYDENLERFTEGRFTTTAKFAMDNGIGGTMVTLLKLMAFQGDAAFKGRKIKKEDREMILANVKKTMHEAYLWTAMSAAYLLVNASIDDDDENKGIKYVVLNTAWRIMGDISFYVSPGTFEQIINNPIPALSILTDFGRFTNTVTKYIDGENEYYDEEALLKNFTRQFPVLNLANKWQYRSERLLNNQ